MKRSGVYQEQLEHKISQIKLNKRIQIEIDGSKIIDCIVTSKKAYDGTKWCIDIYRPYAVYIDHLLQELQNTRKNSDDVCDDLSEHLDYLRVKKTDDIYDIAYYQFIDPDKITNVFGLLKKLKDLE